MVLPRLQVNEQAGPGEFAAVTDEHRAGQQILQPPLTSRQVRPPERDLALGGLAGQVDDHHVPHVVRTRPGPGQEVPAGLVVGPSVGLEQPPRPGPDAVTGDGGEQSLVPGGKLGVGRLVRPPGQEDGRPDPPALELALVPQRGAGQGRDADGSGPLGRRIHPRRDAGLVVVLQEAQQPGLVSRIGPEVVADGGRVLLDDPVIQPLVVAEVEALLLEFRLHVPVRLGDEHDLRVLPAQLADHGRPEFLGRRGPGAGAPGLGEDVVDHEHGHVAPDAVALTGDIGQRLDGRRAHRRRERVELDDVRPRREIRVPAVGQHLTARRYPAGRIRAEVVLGAADEEFRIAHHPRVVRGDVVRHVIEDQPHAAGGQRGPRRR